MYIAYITSDEYAPYAGISLTSIFENNKNVEYIKVFICCYDLSENNKSKFIETSIRYEREIEFIYINDFIEDLENKYNIKRFNGSCVGYSRMFPTKIFPEYVDRILYLDSDTVVIGNLSELYDVEMEKTALLMAENLSFELYPESLPDNERIATNESGKNFNTGVILFNIENYKKYDIEGIFERELLKQDQYAFAEQSISNVCIPKEYIGHIHLKFNYYIHTSPKREEKDLLRIYENIYSIDELKEAIDSPIVIHYLGFQCRSWFKECKSSMKQEYETYKNISEWKNIKPKSIYKSSKYLSMSLKEKIIVRVMIILWDSRLLYLVKKKFNKISKW